MDLIVRAPSRAPNASFWKEKKKKQILAFVILILLGMT